MITVDGKHAYLTLTRSSWFNERGKASCETLVNMRVLNCPDDIEAAKKTLQAYSKSIAYVG